MAVAWSIVALAHSKNLWEAENNEYRQPWERELIRSDKLIGVKQTLSQAGKPGELRHRSSASHTHTQTSP